MTDDPLQDLVYEAERAVWSRRMYENVLPTPFDLVGLMREISESSFVRNVAPVAIRALNPVLESEFKETHPGLFVFDQPLGSRQFFLQLPQFAVKSEFKCTPGMVGLKFPEPGRNAPIVAHEVAHLLRFLELGFQGYVRESDHGCEFQETYLEAVKSVISGGDSAALKACFSRL